MKQKTSRFRTHAYRITILVVLLILQLSIRAQDSTISVVPAVISGQYQLTGGHYLVKSNVLVTKEGALTLSEGTHLHFARNTRVDVKGSLNIQGTAESRVKITSQSPNLQGKGFIITGANPNANVVINYADFSHLSSPITFQINWLRSTVSIENNTFFNNETNRAVVEIQGVDPFLSAGVTEITISQNTFSNNSGNLFVSNIATQEMRVNIANNIFTRNQFYEETGSALFRNPLFVRYNEFGLEVDELISNNAIFDNFYSLRNDSSQTSKRTSINVVGTGPRLNLTGNYLGNPENNELALTMENSGAFFKMPFIAYEAELKTSPENLNGHIYQIYINNELINTDEQWLSLENIDSVSLVFNRPVKAQPISIHQFKIPALTVEKTPIDADYRWSNNNTRLDISFVDALNERKGYLVIGEIFDENGTPVPAIEMGKKRFALQNGMEYSVGLPLNKELLKRKDYALFPTVIQKEEQEDLPEDIERYRKIEFAPGEWEIGFYAGMPIYFGDLFLDYPLVLDPTHTGQRSILSPRVQYNKTGSRWTYEGRINAFLIEGADSKESRVGEYRGTGFDRNLSFRTIIAGLSGVVNYDFKNPRTVRKWIPGFHGGFDVFYFQPQGRYNNQWVNLRPLGTEGQTINGKSDEYSYVSAGVPLGFHFNRYFNTRWKLAFSFTYTYTFTDYLDDVGTGSYPDEAALRAANPNNPDAAVALSNPSGSRGQRSSGTINDAFAFWGLAIYYNIKPKK